MAPAGQTTYQKDERVLCFHHEILYEAKILDVRHVDPDDRKSPYEYLVHYKGWKNTYVYHQGSANRSLCDLSTFHSCLIGFELCPMLSY
jgi:hypothetical protein